MTVIADPTKADRPWLTAAVSVGKDLVSLLRDGALLVLALLLVAFPTQFNAILVNAGFEEGSVLGLKWKRGLVESDKALKEAQAAIEALQMRNDELSKTLAATNDKLKDPALIQRAAKLEDDNAKVNEDALRTQRTVSQAIEANSALVEKPLLSTQPKAEYSVGLQTLGVPDAERVALNDKIHADGYGLDPLTWSYPAGQRPSWFALRNTVFYYSSSSQSAAQELAQLMKSLTGHEFAVQRGAGLGVEPSRRDVTLFVHYLKS